MAATGGTKRKAETLQFKSPAEFFAENQNIAGFDNPGKALYTTIREFVENSLDAAESAGRLPTIDLSVEEMDAKTFNKLRSSMHGLGSSKGEEDSDDDGAAGAVPAGKRSKKKGGKDEDDAEDAEGSEAADGAAESGAAGPATAKGKKGAAAAKKPQELSYYRITCKDNGCGMPHDKIPDFLGRVLAGSKYGVRQTRGKFGLGAKMALIWSKKSTGLPIEVKTAHGVPKASSSSSSSAFASASSSQSSALFGRVIGSDGGTGSTGDTDGSSAPAALIPKEAAPAKVSYCRLDIDIYRNQPQVLEHTQQSNTPSASAAGGSGGPSAEPWIGTAISVVISGAKWSSYRARILNYFQQLAVITPYAQFTLHYTQLPTSISLREYTNSSIFKSGGAIMNSGSSDEVKGKNDFSYVWKRRSTQVPRPPLEVKHHPSAVNDLLLQQLMDTLSATKSGSSSALSLGNFLTTQFQSIDKSRANAIIDEAGLSWDTPLSALHAKEVHAIRVAMENQTFPPPSGWCLSPAGEYNLRLGIMKELRPDLVATASSSVGVYQGHPFLVEAGVALGGRGGTEGLSVHRFANRIPLLFEGGGDVATQTAMKRINWASYKIDANRDKLAVFVSIVSTKIPFKGTGKEYIGDDITELKDAVKQAIQACCNQLKQKLARAAEAREKAGRKKALLKYVPDVTRALMANLKAVQARREEMETQRKKDGSGASADDSVLLTDEDGGSEEGAISAAALDGSGSSSSSSAVGGSKSGGRTDLERAADLVAQGKATTTTAALAIIRAHRTRSHLLSDYSAGRINEALLAKKLTEAVEKADIEAAIEQATAAAGGGIFGSAAGSAGAAGGSPDGSGGGPKSLFIAPLFQAKVRAMPELHHQACVIKLLPSAIVPHKAGTFDITSRALSTGTAAGGRGGAAAAAARSRSTASSALVSSSFTASSATNISRTAHNANAGAGTGTAGKAKAGPSSSAEQEEAVVVEEAGSAQTNNDNNNNSLFSPEELDELIGDL
jgi:DNA topoisomerase VI subunit B